MRPFRHRGNLLVERTGNFSQALNSCAAPMSGSAHWQTSSLHAAARTALTQPCPSPFAVRRSANAMDSEPRAGHTQMRLHSASGVLAMPTYRAPQQLSRAAPITCPKCGGRAPLIRMSPDAFTRGQMEIWTYECAACGHKVEKRVPSGPTRTGPDSAGA
jgi:DNA-directed RNA polymerase subunit RPC12/RpoP